jgi:hypothetical protein
VRELRTLKPTRWGSRIRSVQGRLSMEFGDEDAATENPAKPDSAARSSGFRRPSKSATSNPERTPNGRPPAPTFHPLAYRSVVAGWPVEFRELWGRRANELEETGLPWRDAETQAFVEVWPQFRRSMAETEAQTRTEPEGSADE